MLRMDTNSDSYDLYIFLKQNSNMKIVLNASNLSNELKGLIDFKANLQQLVGCHNFYPLNYTGLDEALFIKQSKTFTEHQIPVFAFLASQSKEQSGVFPENDKLPTLEILRNESVGFQYRYFMASQSVNGVLFSTQFIPREDFEEINKFDFKLCKN